MDLQQAIQIYRENQKLWRAVNSKVFKKIEEAIDNGANLHVCEMIERRASDNFLQDSPLHIAAKLGFNKAISFLIRKGANPNEFNRLQQCPVHWAAYFGHLDSLQLLISLGADLFPKDDDGETPLTWAANQGHIEIVDFILAKSIDINIQGEKDGYTALHWAAREGKTKMVKHLLQKGANKHIENNSGLTPFDIAMIYGKFSTAKVLKNGTVNI